MKVFIVENGEQNEGGSVVSVHRTHEGAVKAALNVEAHFKGGWRERGSDWWENGCDYVKVSEFEIED